MNPLIRPSPLSLPADRQERGEDEGKREKKE